jgi:hypothetical protein
MSDFKKLKQLLNSKDLQDNDDLSALQSGYLPNQSMNTGLADITNGVGNVLKNLIGDKPAPSEFSPQGGGIQESMSPIDFITPNMIAAPINTLKKGAELAAEKFYKAQAKGLFGNELGNIGKNIKELPMNYVDRMARAKEMGFNPEKVYYHGTTSDIKEFNPKFNGKHTIDSNTNIGHYFTDDANLAGAYTTDSKNGNIIPVYLKMENPNIIDLQDTSIPIFRSDLINKSKELGHDSIIFKNALDYGSGGIPSEIPIVFNPNQIRSINAEFNPSKKMSKNILAGLGAIGLGTSELKNDENLEKFKNLTEIIK